jgi:pseudouridine synthase
VEVIRRTKKNAWLAIEIRQGKYHQIRRMCERVGHPVLKLKRISWGPIHLGGLRQGKWRWLKREEIERLKTLVVASEERQMGKKDTWDH